MNAYANWGREDKTVSFTSSLSQKAVPKSSSSIPTDNSSALLQMKAMQQIADESPFAQQQKGFLQLAQSHAAKEDSVPIQRMRFSQNSKNDAPIQRTETPTAAPSSTPMFPSFQMPDMASRMAEMREYMMPQMQAAKEQIEAARAQMPSMPQMQAVKEQMEAARAQMPEFPSGFTHPHFQDPTSALPEMMRTGQAAVSDQMDDTIRSGGTI